MATVRVYIPVWDGKAYQMHAIAATVPVAKAPEGEPCLDARAMKTVPPERLQPDPPTP